jgi:hypothetical protein
MSRASSPKQRSRPSCSMESLMESLSSSSPMAKVGAVALGLAVMLALLPGGAKGMKIEGKVVVVSGASQGIGLGEQSPECYTGVLGQPRIGAVR